MAHAGLLLLAAAADAVGEGLPADATEAQQAEREARHSYNIAFKQGFEAGQSAGVEGTLKLLTEVLIKQRDGGTPAVPAERADYEAQQAA